MHFHLNLISGVSLYARCQLCGIEKCKCVLSGRIAGTSKASLPLPRFERVCNAETTPVDDDDYGARGRDPFGIVISANVYIAYLRLIIMLVSRKKILFTSISESAERILATYSPVCRAMPMDKRRKGEIPRLHIARVHIVRSHYETRDDRGFARDRAIKNNDPFPAPLRRNSPQGWSRARPERRCTRAMYTRRAI